MSMTGCAFEKKSERISIRVSESTKIALIQSAQKHDRPVGWIIEKIIRQYFKLNGK
jgi:predicted DNA binding CopG/RHH family protein